jgi:penicillin G amidase
MRWPSVFVALGALAACSDDPTSGPFDGLPLDGDFAVGVTAPVHVARDRDGVAHIRAHTLADAAFVQGYVTAHDRLPQMDILRRTGAGTLAELYGEQDPSVIDGDLEMRMHRMTPLAQATWSALQASSDATDQEVVELLARFADGVNAYATDLRRGTWTIDPAIAISFDPARLVAWTPIDSLVIGRLQALSQAFSVPFELDATELYQKLRTTFDAATSANPAGVARHGLSRDLLRFAPVGTEPTIAGFPNVDRDTGSRADGSDPGTSRRGRPAMAASPASPASRASPATRAGPATPASPASVTRPAVPQSLLDDARAWFSRDIHNGPRGALGSHALRPPHTGGNAWAVGAALAGGGHVMLAADPHLPLSNPSMFYPTHLIVDDPARAPLDVLGVTIPGVPGVMFGTNGSLAWAATASAHDVNDVYLEQIAPCPDGGGDCVAWTDAGGAAQRVPIERVTEQINVGTLGAISRSVPATYEVVPHHGPIIPTLDPATHTLRPRTGTAALSIRSTADQPTFELRALDRLAHAHSLAEGFRAIGDITYGGQSWVMIDTDQHIGWTTQAQIPVRAAAVYAWDPLVDQDALAPFFVLPGTGEADWRPDQAMSPRYVPHAIDPPAGFVVAANADPVGATFDGKPLDQRDATGAPLYAGVAYTAGLRAARITTLLRDRAAAPGGVTLDDLAAIQRDTYSSVGAALAPMLLAALGRLDRQNVGPPDVNPYLDALSAADLARLATARRLIAAWTFATPAATDAPDDDSAATALFNTWMHYFVERTLADELDAIGFDVWRLDDDVLIRIVHALLHDPNSFVTSPATQQPILCDNYAVLGPDDSCTKAILQAMVDAMTRLASPQGFGADDPGAWRWGQLHRRTLTPLVPAPALDLPAPTDATPAGFPRAGDDFAVGGGDAGWSDLAFATRSDGPALRWLAEAAPGGPITVRWALAGGVIYDRRSPHYRDLLDRSYLTDQAFEAASSTEQIVAAGEARWVFR